MLVRYLPMTTIPNDILEAVRTDDDEAFDALVANDECAFLVDHRAEEEEIVTECEAVLKTGRLSAEFTGDELFVVFGPKRVKVPLTLTPADRHIALLSLNEALNPEFEVRMLYASVDSDTGAFVPLRRDAWAALELESPEVVARRFHVLTPHPNTFTESVKVPRKPGTRPWWRFWAGR